MDSVTWQIFVVIECSDTEEERRRKIHQWMLWILPHCNKWKIKQRSVFSLSILVLPIDHHILQNEYTDWERPARSPIGSRDATMELLSDGHTAAPLIRMAYLHSVRGGRSYFLHFRHQTTERDFPQVSFPECGRV